MSFVRWISPTHRLRSCLPAPRSISPRLVLPVLCSLLSIPFVSLADTIILLNGKVIEGQAEDRGDRVLVRPWDSSASIILPRNNIEKIIPGERPDPTREDANPAPAEEGTPDSPETEPPETAREKGAAPPEHNEGAPSAVESSSGGAYSPSTASAGRRMPRIGYFYSTVPDAQVRSAIESLFPKVIEVCVNQLGMAFKGYVPLRIEVIHDTERFEALHKALLNRHKSIQGFYSPQLDQIVIRGDKLRMDIVSTLYHEGVHALLRREFAHPPAWIDEGLAEFFEGFRVHGRSAIALDPDGQDAWAKLILNRGEMIPLREYLHLTNKEWRDIETSGEIKYRTRIMAWSLITFLMSHEEGRLAFTRYLQAIKYAEREDLLAVGFDELDAAYPGGVKSLENRWHRWILEVRQPLKY